MVFRLIPARTFKSVASASSAIPAYLPSLLVADPAKELCTRLTRSPVHVSGVGGQRSLAGGAPRRDGSTLTRYLPARAPLSPAGWRRLTSRRAGTQLPGPTRGGIPWHSRFAAPYRPMPPPAA